MSEYTVEITPSLLVDSPEAGHRALYDWARKYNDFPAALVFHEVRLHDGAVRRWVEFDSHAWTGRPSRPHHDARRLTRWLDRAPVWAAPFVLALLIGRMPRRIR